jgi:hypothetical protein
MRSLISFAMLMDVEKVTGVVRYMLSSYESDGALNGG